MSSYPQQPGPQGYQPGAYGYPQQPPQKSNVVWWVVGGVATLVLICCCAGIALFGYAANEAGEGVSSGMSSYSASSSSAAQSATPVAEGESVTLGDAQIESGWTIDQSSGEPVNLKVTNTSDVADSYYINVYFMKDGELIEDTSCSSGYLEPGDSDITSCIGIYTDVDYDEIRMSEGV